MEEVWKTNDHVTDVDPCQEGLLQIEIHRKCIVSVQ